MGWYKVLGMDMLIRFSTLMRDLGVAMLPDSFVSEIAYNWPGAASSSTLGSLYPSCAVTDCHGAKVVGAVVSAATAAGAPDGCGSMSRGEKCGNDGKDILELAEDIDDAIIWARIVLVLVTSARTILMRQHIVGQNHSHSWLHAKPQLSNELVPDTPGRAWYAMIDLPAMRKSTLAQKKPSGATKHNSF
ncbi:uncharacterized protein BO96DRAFT_433288 [Aspergillus niger CBS 101883]|uniref:Uncharacterized protein n=2 Tax=Aspergillus niger TaxID=5061 RepID=A2QZP5_ASPNC|nr:uncharacterized protein BO96DRAFT_433288 [Aspergillus niger CBS 101883]XP_059604486.1 hypothetical protein An12g05690 [Aspergillus niger]PYH57843.1 hypothetical protein BO96DRAFT_433288 [Aspergillus niger CBS 101883]CAK46277.1 hypothetical protein An12g05690 [Aspergillus niger]